MLMTFLFTSGNYVVCVLYHFVQFAPHTVLLQSFMNVKTCVHAHTNIRSEMWC